MNRSFRSSVIAIAAVGAAQVVSPALAREASHQPYDHDGITVGPPSYAKQGEGWDGAGAGTANLTYRFTNSTADMGVATQQAEVLRAMNLWSKYANINWTPTALAGQSDSLEIGWHTGNHGDGSNFDGAGGVLAHAFYPAPPNPESIAGDLHFDDGESWTSATSGGINLYTVAIHELGHSLGLDHSADTRSIMYAFYAGGSFGNALSTDDIAGIRDLYGARYPTFSATVRGTHSWRADLTITVGVKDSIGGATLWETDVHLAAGGNLDDFDYSEIDLGEGAAFANGSNVWFAEFNDSFAGSDTGGLNEFSIRFGTPGDWETVFSSDTGAFSAGGGTAYISGLAIPEPTTAALFGSAMLLTLVRRRR